MRIGMSAVGFSQQGGIERASLELAKALRAQGDEVTLLAEHVDPAVVDGLEVLRVPMPPTPSSLRTLVYPRRASRVARRRDFDVLHDQGATALWSADVVTAHSCHRAWWDLKQRTGESLRAWLNPFHHAVLATERHTYRAGGYARVIAVSAGVGRELTHWYGVPPERIRVIPNAVDAARFGGNGSAAAAAIRRRYGLADDDLVLVFVGKEFRRKGLGPAIDALRELPDHVKLLVVGGDEPSPFRQRAAQAGVAARVVFAGHTDRVEHFFAAADVFVFPTLYEAFALVSLEAAASGLPVVATRVNGTEDFIRDGENGFFVERSGTSIARAVDRFVADPSLARRLGEVAREDARKLTWSAAAEQTRAVYAEALEERRAAAR